MLRATAALCAALLPVGWAILPAARAAEGPRAEQNAAQLRDFTLRNDTGKTIVDAHAYTTDGKDIAITKDGPIRPEMAQNFMTQASGCLSRIEIRMQDGARFARQDLNDCNDPRLVARSFGITVESSARGPLHPSAASQTGTAAVNPAR